MATESTGHEAPLQDDVKEHEDAANGPIEKPNNEVDEEAEFVWEEYLEESNSVAAPPTAFIHVEQSIQSCFTEGMKLEVPNKHTPESYWIASVIMTCGPLLRLRFEGYDEDRSADFWCDIATSEVHPIGWCAQNKKTLAPPPELEDKHVDWSLALVQALTGANTVPSYLLEANGTTPADLIKQGMKIEVQEKLNPSCVWLATILENVGGRLLLRYEGSGSTDDFWLFYLSYRLHPVGWATQNQCKYKPPDGMTLLHSQDQWAEILRQAMEEASKFPIPHDIFKNQEKLENHQFKEGMKLEAVNPSTLMQFCPATVSKVIDDVFFLVQIDDHSVVDHQPLVMCCHAKSPFIFPVGWAKANGLKIMHPKGWLNYRQEFEWSDYLTYCKAEAAPSHLLNLDKYEHGFEKGMKLEAVNPFQPHQLCAATITKIVHHLLWIQLDSIDSFHPNHIVPVNSHDIFPVGWCESNGYPLKPPLNCQQRKACLMKKVAIVIPEKQYMDKKKKPEKVEKSGSDAKAWCPKIFFNHRCFSGPYLSKGRIAELPRDVGPGPVTLVLREVLSMLINVAYKSSRVLRELQLQTKPNPSMHQCVLKAKYKGKCHRAMVEVVRNSEKVAEFCRSICVKLECCPYLFGPEYVGDNCPDQCSKLTKTKYTYYGKRKKKIGRPPIVEAETETVNKIGNKRGRKRKIIDQEGKENGGGTVSNTNNKDNKVENEEEKSVVTDEIDCKPQDDDSKDDQALKQKRKYVKYIPPKSDIVTRGAKIPNFALEMNRRRHKKHRVTGSPVSTSSSNSRTSSEDGSKETFDSVLLDPEPQLIPKEEEKISNEFQLQTNPLHWSVDEVIHFIKGTDCAQFARLFRDQDIDGQALLLLTLPTVQEHLDLKLGPAIKLCHQIEKIKFAFYSQFAK